MDSYYIRKPKTVIFQKLPSQEKLQSFLEQDVKLIVYHTGQSVDTILPVLKEEKGDVVNTIIRLMKTE